MTPVTIDQRPHGTLDGIEVFAGLTAAARRALAARCAWREVKPHQEIVRHQDDTRTVFFLTAGKARATIYSKNGKQVTFRDINSGDIFGELAAIDGSPRSASVEATSRCTVAAMSAELFWDVLRSEPAVMAGVLKLLSRQVRALSDKLVDLSTKEVRRRILAELLRIAEPSETEFGNAVLFPAPTNADIAARVATARETVNRELKWLMGAGIVQKHGSTLVIPDFERLRRLVGEEQDEVATADG
jgi:CRP/FNR family transcriptional regulator, cyclic AMP receptor protein